MTTILHDCFEDIRARSPVEREQILRPLQISLALLLKETSVVKIRPQLEHATQLLGICLTVVNELPAEHTELGDNMTIKVAQIYRSILYGDRPTKKVSISVTNR